MSIPVLVPVSSSNVSAVGYEQSARKLFVEFNDGSLYEYSNVSAQTHQSMMTSSSKGRFVRQELVDRYPYTRLR